MFLPYDKKYVRRACYIPSMWRERGKLYVNKEGKKKLKVGIFKNKNNKKKT